MPNSSHLPVSTATESLPLGMVDPSHRGLPADFNWWWALARVLGSIEVLREARVLYVLVCAFAGSGLALAMAQSSFGRGSMVGAVLEGAFAMFLAFYGTNAAGLMVMDRVRGVPVRDALTALGDALGLGHRVLVVVGSALLGAALLVAALLGLMWMSRWPVVGPPLFALVVPLAVVVLGALLLGLVGVVGPMAGPLVWWGAGSWSGLRRMAWLLRHRWVQSSVLMVGLSLVTGLVAAASSFVVMVAGRLMAEAAVVVLGVDLDPGWLMAGLFGHGLRGVNLQGIAPPALPYLSSALAGGGVVFVMALVLPTLVYLRGVCEIYLVLRETEKPAP